MHGLTYQKLLQNTRLVFNQNFVRHENLNLMHCSLFSSLLLLGSFMNLVNLVIQIFGIYQIVDSKAFPLCPCFSSNWMWGMLQNPTEADKLAKIQKDLDETKVILVRKYSFLSPSTISHQKPSKPSYPPGEYVPTTDVARTQKIVVNIISKCQFFTDVNDIVHLDHSSFSFVYQFWISPMSRSVVYDLLFSL